MRRFVNPRKTLKIDFLARLSLLTWMHRCQLLLALSLPECSISELIGSRGDRIRRHNATRNTLGRKAAEAGANPEFNDPHRAQTNLTLTFDALPTCTCRLGLEAFLPPLTCRLHPHTGRTRPPRQPYVSAWRRKLTRVLSAATSIQKPIVEPWASLSCPLNGCQRPLPFGPIAIQAASWRPTWRRCALSSDGPTLALSFAVPLVSCGIGLWTLRLRR